MLILCAQAMAFLERQYGVKTYIYDICPGEECAAVFRGEFRLHTHCPRCGADRWDSKGKPLKKLYYLSISDWIQKLLKDPDMARWLLPTIFKPVPTIVEHLIYRIGSNACMC